MENKKILFISALSAELKIVKQEIKKLSISNDIEISFFVCWMWNYKTIMNLWLFLTQQKYDFIVNVWVCWYSGGPTEKNVGVIPCVHPVIQISGIKNISNNKELISPVFLEFTKIKSIFCSEKIIYSINDLIPLNKGEDFLKENQGDSFVDMESYWFEMVCDKFDIPRIILKIPVDKIWEETKNFDFEKAKRYLAENINYSELLEKIQKYLEKTSPHISPLEEREYKVKNKILNFYKFTFSEKIIINKLLNKFIVLELGNLEEFFEKNRELGKKEFLRKLKNLSES